MLRIVSLLSAFVIFLIIFKIVKFRYIKRPLKIGGPISDWSGLIFMATGDVYTLFICTPSI